MTFHKINPLILSDTGLLFQINRSILHPLGMALVLQVDDETGESELYIAETKDPDGIVFSEKTFLEGEAKLEKFMNDVGKSKRATRKSILGFEEQISADQGVVSSLPPPPKDSEV